MDELNESFSFSLYSMLTDHFERGLKIGKKLVSEISRWTIL
jgi:hypothetical protein